MENLANILILCGFALLCFPLVYLKNAVLCLFWAPRK